MKTDIDRNAELAKEKACLKGSCSSCHVIRKLIYNSKGHLKCSVCNSLYVEVLYKEIEA